MDLLTINFQRMNKSFALVQDSITRLRPLEPAMLNNSLAMEPYDALTSRFERFTEIALNRFFRSVEIHQFSKSSDSLRDRLLMMQKFGLISSVEIWMEMRDFRNRIAHDYLPEQLAAMFNGIRDRFGPEMKLCVDESAQFMIKMGLKSDVSP